MVFTNLKEIAEYMATAELKTLPDSFKQPEK